MTFIEAFEVAKNRNTIEDKCKVERAINILKLYSNLATKEELEFIETL